MEFGGVKLFQNLRGVGNRHVFNVTGHWMSEKYDGVRAIYLGNNKLVTCRGLKIEAPESFFDGWPEGYIFDGELWIGKGCFSTISGLCRRSAHDVPSLWDSVRYLVFDLIPTSQESFPSHLRPTDLFRSTFESRQEILQKILPSLEHDLPTSLNLTSFNGSTVTGSTIQAPTVRVPIIGLGASETPVDGYGDPYSDDNDDDQNNDVSISTNQVSLPKQHIYCIKQYFIPNLETFQRFYQFLIKGGSEGVVIVPKGEHYRPGVRSNYKLKEVDEIEAVVINYNVGNGRNSGLIGSFQVQMVQSDGTVQPKKTFSIGTGLTQYQRQHGRELYPVGTVLTCHYNGLTSTGIPRFPRLKGVRPDFVLKNFVAPVIQVDSLKSRSEMVSSGNSTCTPLTLEQIIVN